MTHKILWILIAMLLAWLVYRRLRKGSFMAAIGMIFSIVLTAYLGLAVLLWIFQSRMLYMPTPKIEAAPSDLRLAFEDIRIPTPDGQTLAAWYIPAENARYTVLFCHGNAGNISHRLDTLDVFNKLGLNCLIFDYRGYGQSTGSPTEEGTIQDGLAARQWLLDNKQVAPADIILFGRSLGGAVAARIAARTADIPSAGLVIESSFTSFTDIGSHYYPWLPVQWFARFSYDSLDALKSIHCPVAVIHSPDDDVIPYKMGCRLYETARSPKHFAELKGTHNEGFVDNHVLYRSLWQTILTFLTESQRASEIVN
jgi:fermentation-respiration switch protein FrsA (DUF1100 family)